MSSPLPGNSKSNTVASPPGVMPTTTSGELVSLRTSMAHAINSPQALYCPQVAQSPLLSSVPTASLSCQSPSLHLPLASASLAMFGSLVRSFQYTGDAGTLAATAASQPTVDPLSASPLLAQQSTALAHTTFPQTAPMLSPLSTRGQLPSAMSIGSIQMQPSPHGGEESRDPATQASTGSATLPSHPVIVEDSPPLFDSLPSPGPEEMEEPSHGGLQGTVISTTALVASFASDPPISDGMSEVRDSSSHQVATLTGEPDAPSEPDSPVSPFVKDLDEVPTPPIPPLKQVTSLPTSPHIASAIGSDCKPTVLKRNVRYARRILHSIPQPMEVHCHKSDDDDDKDFKTTPSRLTKSLPGKAILGHTNTVSA